MTNRRTLRITTGIIAAIAALGMIATLAGCGTTEPETVETTPVTSPTTDSTDAPDSDSDDDGDADDSDEGEDTVTKTVFECDEDGCGTVEKQVPAPIDRSTIDPLPIGKVLDDKPEALAYGDHVYHTFTGDKYIVTKDGQPLPDSVIEDAEEWGESQTTVDPDGWISTKASTEDRLISRVEDSTGKTVCFVMHDTPSPVDNGDGVPTYPVYHTASDTVETLSDAYHDNYEDAAARCPIIHDDVDEDDMVILFQDIEK